MAKSQYQPTKQDLLDAGLNVFAIDLLVESFLKRGGMIAIDDETVLEFFFPINRSDCAAFAGVNITLQPVPK